MYFLLNKKFYWFIMKSYTSQNYSRKWCCNWVNSLSPLNKSHCPACLVLQYNGFISTVSPMQFPTLTCILVFQYSMILHEKSSVTSTVVILDTQNITINNTYEKTLKTYLYIYLCSCLILPLWIWCFHTYKQRQTTKKH